MQISVDSIVSHFRRRTKMMSLVGHQKHEAQGSSTEKSDEATSGGGGSSGGGRPGLVRKIKRTISNGCTELARQASSRSLFSTASTSSQSYQLDSSYSSEEEAGKEDDSEAQFLAELSTAVSNHASKQEGTTTIPSLLGKSHRLSETRRTSGRMINRTKLELSPKSVIGGRCDSSSESDGDSDDDDDDDLFQQLDKVVARMHGGDEKLNVVPKAVSMDEGTPPVKKIFTRKDKPSPLMRKDTPSLKGAPKSIDDAYKSQRANVFPAQQQMNGVTVGSKAKKGLDRDRMNLSTGSGVVKKTMKKVSDREASLMSRSTESGMVRKVTKKVSERCSLIRQNSSDCARSFFSNSSGHSYQLDSDSEGSDSDLDDIDEFAGEDPDVEKDTPPAEKGVAVKASCNETPTLVPEEPPRMDGDLSQSPAEKKETTKLVAETCVLKIPAKSDHPPARRGLVRSMSTRHVGTTRRDIAMPGRSGHQPPRRGLERTMSTRQVAFGTKLERSDHLPTKKSSTSKNTKRTVSKGDSIIPGLERSCSFRIEHQRPCVMVKEDSSEKYMQLNISCHDDDNDSDGTKGGTATATHGRRSLTRPPSL